MIRRPPRSTLSSSSAASDVYKRQTQLNKQGPDIGTQYRSEIFYTDDNQKKIAEKIKNEFNDKFKGKVVTKVSKEKLYQPAEEYHQYYLKRKSFI